MNGGFRELVHGRRVLLIAVKEGDYIRVRQLKNILAEEAAETRLLAAGQRNPLLRLPTLYRQIARTDIASYDVIVAAFLPQMVLPRLRRRLERAGWRGTLVADFFISIYDTLCLDRRALRPHGLAGRLLHRLDERTLAAADHILADTQSDAAWFAREFHADPARFEVMYLRADEAIYWPGAELSLDAREAGAAPVYRVLYFGTGLPLQGIDVLLEALRIAAARETERKAGRAARGADGADVPTLAFTVIGRLGRRQRRKAAAIPGCRWIPWLSQEALAREIAGSELCLAGHFADAGADGKGSRVVPGKAFIYEAMGKEMILGDGAGNREVFSEDARHHFVPMGDAEALAERIAACRDAHGCGGRA